MTDAFPQLLSNLELTDTFQDTVSTHYNAVSSYVTNQMPHAKVRLIGSLQKKTRIHPRPEDKFDIDMLLVLGDVTAWAPNGTTPAQALSQADTVFKESARYRELNPSVDAPTVSMVYSDKVHLEVVPAFVDNIGHNQAGTFQTVKGRGFWIPHGDEWIYADYDHDAAMITAANKDTGGLLVPTIKMLKAIKREHFPDMKSFHVEVLAATWLPKILEAHAQQRVPVTYPKLLRSFFAWTGNILHTPHSLPGSVSPAVKLDPLSSLQISPRFPEIVNHIDMIERQTSDVGRRAAWSTLFGNPYPKT